MSDSGADPFPAADDFGERPVLLVRGQAVVLDSVVAIAFGVETREVNQAVKRNEAKFDDRHTFRLTRQERDVLTSQGVISKPKGRGGSQVPPAVFTQKGVARLATVLESPRALEATDEMIDLFMEVYGQLMQGQTEVAISNPGRLLPRDQEMLGDIRQKLMQAVASLLDTKIGTSRKTTLGEALGTLGEGVLDHFRARLETKSLSNEKLQAETLLILERAREVRLRTDVEIEGKALENLDRKLDLVDKYLKMIARLEPTAFATLLPSMVPAGAIGSAPFRRPALLDAPGDRQIDHQNATEESHD